jgi:hypothetical protein
MYLMTVAILSGEMEIVCCVVAVLMEYFELPSRWSMLGGGKMRVKDAVRVESSFHMGRG